MGEDDLMAAVGWSHVHPGDSAAAVKGGVEDWPLRDRGIQRDRRCRLLAVEVALIQVAAGDEVRLAGSSREKH